MAQSESWSGCLVKPGAAYRGKQGLDYTPGISAESVGAKGLWFGTLTLPPVGRTTAHFHEDHETAIYIVSGYEATMYTGEHLEIVESVRAGDFLYIPAGIPHVVVNRSETPMSVVLARTDPNEQESVVLRPDLEHLFP
jgi:uncharacterized RmlC-like cupin family protein